ncbi:MAG: hypothetical protein Q7S56_03445 [Nanoarchaeota archaeon]|nr:hypothetical protein [Nanoarchaeota archaeon]
MIENKVEQDTRIPIAIVSDGSSKPREILYNELGEKQMEIIDSYRKGEFSFDKAKGDLRVSLMKRYGHTVEINHDNLRSLR